jgi:hypothetical protein
MRNSTEEKQVESKSLTNERTNIQGCGRQASKPELGLKSCEREQTTETVTQSPFAHGPKRRTSAPTSTGKSKTELQTEKAARPDSKEEQRQGKTNRTMARACTQKRRPSETRETQASDLRSKSKLKSKEGNNTRE